MKFVLLGIMLWIGSFCQNESEDQLFAIYSGRTPCQEVAGKFTDPVSSECFKLKWKVNFYKDAAGQPSRFEISNTFRRAELHKGSWKITKGTPTDPNSEVYELTLESGKQVLFMNADDQVLFFLNDKRELMVGNYDFSYMLNRAQK